MQKNACNPDVAGTGDDTDSIGEGTPEDEYLAEKVIDALNFGFPFSEALAIRTEDALLEIINIKEHTKRADLPSVRARIIGKDGKIIKNRVGPLVSLDDLPNQDWSIWEKERFYKPMGGKVWICGPIELDRGCPHRCAFCCNAGLQDLYRPHGFYPRNREVEKFIEEFKDKKVF